MERLQARDEPVAQDPTSVAEPDLEERKRQRSSVAQSVRRALGR